MGTVSQIRLKPTTVSNVVTYTVIVDARNEDELLLPGMSATADFIVQEARNVLLVPNAAFQFKPQTTPDAGGARNDRAGRNAGAGRSGGEGRGGREGLAAGNGTDRTRGRATPDGDQDDRKGTPTEVSVATDHQNEQQGNRQKLFLNVHSNDPHNIPDNNETQSSSSSNLKAHSNIRPKILPQTERKRLYVQDSDGQLRETWVMAGITDGMKTVIEPTAEIQEGVKVATGFKQVKQDSPRGGLNELVRPPRGSGPPR